jgi:transcriptional regulator with XRE-family HTH domain
MGEKDFQELDAYGRDALMSLTEIVARNLQAARAQRKLTQSALARKAKVSISYVSMLERGERTPPLETLEVMAKALSVSPLALLQKQPGNSPRRGRR